MTWLCIGAGIFWLDFLIKNLAERKLQKGVRKEAGNTGFFLQKVYNKGFAFNKMDSKPVLVKYLHGLTMAAVILYSLIAVFFHRGQKLAAVGYSFIIGGGSSNLFDRIKRGYVIDYLGLPGIKKVVFNLSDLFVFLGSVFVLLGELAKKK